MSKPIDILIKGAVQEAVSVRDKWWEERIEKAVDDCLERRCPVTKPCYSRFGSPYCSQWQSLKQSLEDR